MAATSGAAGRSTGEVLVDRFRESPDFRVGVRCREVAEIPPEVPRGLLTAPHSTGFQLVLFAHGDCPAHMVDFAEHRLRAGQVLWVRPGQVHRFGDPARYRARYVVAHPGFLAPRTAARTGLDDHTLPSLLRPAPPDLARIDAAVRHLHAEIDLSRDLPPRQVDAVLRPLLTVLLLHLSRVARAQRDTAGPAPTDPVLTAFRTAVEQHYPELRSVSAYARLLGCAPRTLERAVQAATGRTPKQYIDDRVVLEAKRLLAHTDLPARRVGERLGFPDPANFGKFFRSRTGTNPAAFRTTST